MSDLFEPVDEDEVLFESAYGGFPKLLLYGAVPFLICVGAALFVCAVWFPNGQVMKSMIFSPDIAKNVVCPGIWSLCALLFLLNLYRNFHPQRIVITNAGLVLPKGRFTAEEVEIAWDDLSATLFTSRVEMHDMYEVTCVDNQSGTKVRIASMLFREFDDFASFARIVGRRVGEDWSIKGFLPGTIRGRKKKRS